MWNYTEYLKLVNCISETLLNSNVNDNTTFVNAVVDNNEPNG